MERRARAWLPAVAGSAMLVLAGCGTTGSTGQGETSPPSSPSTTIVKAPARAEGRLRISQHQTACCYTEGQVSYLNVRDGDGEAIIKREFQAINPATPVIDVQLPTGHYEVESFQRPCEGNCGYLDPPTDRCVERVSLTKDDDVFLSVEFAPGEGCEIERTEQPLASPVPDEFALREPYRDCGLDFSLELEDHEVGAERQCFVDASVAGDAAELRSYEAGRHPEAPDFFVYRTNPDRTVEVYLPNLGRPTDGPWRRYTCRALVDDPVVGFRLTDCTDPVRLAEPAPPSTEPSRTTVTSVIARFSVRNEHHETGTTYCPVLATNFVDRSTGQPTSWRWEFPDGSTSTEQHPRLEEAVAGDVSLTVSNAESSDTITQDVSYAVC